MSLSLEITRNNHKDAGYDTLIYINKDTKKKYILINSIVYQGAAYNAGLRLEHIGWNIISVNKIKCLTMEEVIKLLDLTRKPNYRFTIEISCIDSDDLSNNTFINLLKNYVEYK